MKEELEQKLVQKYPSIFRDYRGDMRQTCMAWGFECGDGWYNLINELCEKLSKYDDVVAVQVKEKFGGLRFYISGVDKSHYDEVYKYIEEAEEKSIKICEVCGEPGKIRGGGWIHTSCELCNKKRDLGRRPWDDNWNDPID